MGKVLDTAPDRQESGEHCRHYWIIESPNGPTSWGVCKYCGAKREFNNYLPTSSWEEDKSTSGNLPDSSDS